MTPSVTDWINVGLTSIGVILAGIGGLIALKTFRHQRDAHDVGVALSIFVEINRYWDSIINDEENYDYYIGQILAQFETASALIRTGILTHNASLILEDHILEVYANLKEGDATRKAIERCRSADSTFENLEWLMTKRFGKTLNAVRFRQGNQPPS